MFILRLLVNKSSVKLFYPSCVASGPLDTRKTLGVLPFLVLTKTIQATNDNMIHISGVTDE